jgi:hypothetical protein
MASMSPRQPCACAATSIRDSFTSTGLGIRWQKALAHEARAGQLKAEKAPAAEVERLLRAALSEAREVLARPARQLRGLVDDALQLLAHLARRLAHLLLGIAAHRTRLPCSAG